LNFRVGASTHFKRPSPTKVTQMLAEKFFLVLESLIRGSRTYPDGAPRVISTSPHVPVKLPGQK
jgi:hypothetical protein